MDQEQGLTREGTRPAITDLAESGLDHPHARALRVGASTPVSHPVFAAYRIRSEAFHWARSGPIRIDWAQLRLSGVGDGVAGQAEEGGGDGMFGFGGWGDKEEDEEEEERETGNWGCHGETFNPSPPDREVD